MPFYKSFFAATLLLALSGLAAFAQGTSVMVIDDVRILRESKAGQDIQRKLQAIETQINNELEPGVKALETDAKAIEPKIQGKTREQIAGDAALVSQLTAFQTKQQEYGQKRQIAAREFAMTEEKAIVDFNRALEPALTEVIQEKSAQVVILKSQAIFAADAVDATAAVIQKLDQKTPAIAVTRQRLPAGAAQGN